MPSAVGRGGIHGCLDTSTVIPFTYSPESQLCCLHTDVVDLECEVVLSLAAGSGELFSLRPWSYCETPLGHHSQI